MEQELVQYLRQQMATVLRRRALVITCLLVALAVATIYNFASRPLYQATAQILIDRDTPNVLQQKELLDVGRGTDYLNTQYNLLRGRSLAEKVVSHLGLQRSAEFTAGPLMSPVERLQRTVAGPSEDKPQADVALTPAVSAFRSRLTIDPVPASSLVNLRFRAYDPVIAARAVNALAELYIEQSLDFRFETSTEATGWLSERMNEQKRKVEEAERALQDYREREGMLNGDERRDLVEQKLTAVTAAVMDARTERITKETLYNQMKALPPSRLETFPQMMASSTLQGLRSQLVELQREEVRLSETVGSKHPEMVRVRSEMRGLEGKIAAEMQNIVRSVETDYRTSQQQEANLQASLDVVREEANILNRKSISYGVLEREVVSNQQLFQNLMNRTKETGLESELKQTNIRIVERALIPGAPISPRRAWNYQVAVLAGLLCGVALVFLAEQLDNTIKTPEDVKLHVKAPFLGMVADATSAERKTAAAAGVPSPSALILGNPRSPVADAYRVIRTNIIFSSAETTGRALVVSSVNPSEGKSTTVVNVAASLAQNGSRVLVIDADLRRPTIHDHFELASTPGLTDVIVGQIPAAEAIRKTTFGGLDVLACGYVPPNPAELLGSTAMKELVALLRKQYDYVLVDTPPILAMADTPVLCRFTDGLVLVIAAERTTRPAIDRTIEQIVSVGGRVLGVVLNRVDLERNSHYFGQYYGEYYRSYYADGTAPAAVPAGTRPARRA